jgi:hypothetical protein
MRQLGNSAIRVRASQVESLANVLARAYYDNPGISYIVPDPFVRRSALSWFFNSVAIRASRLCGEVYTTANVDGGALWIRPGTELTIRHAMKTEILSLPFGMDRLSVTRWTRVMGHLETVRRSLADKLHWYLVALGTGPSQTAAAIRGTLLSPVLTEADWDRRLCYVETFDERDLPFYQQWGFQITGAGEIPNGGPNFWTLIRPPVQVVQAPAI